MRDLVACESIFGNTVLIPRDQLSFRPSVYAVIVHEDRILLLNSRTANRLALPGGGVDIGEPMAIALKREVREETGLAVEIGRLLHFSESFFHYDPSGNSWHTFRFLYECTPTTWQLVADEDVDDGEVEKPRWVAIDGLNSVDFQSFGDFLVEHLKNGRNYSL